MTTEEITHDILHADFHYACSKGIGYEAKVKEVEMNNVPFLIFWRRIMIYMELLSLRAVAKAHEKEFKRLHKQVEKATGKSIHDIQRSPEVV